MKGIVEKTRHITPVGTSLFLLYILMIGVSGFTAAEVNAQDPIRHDAEHYVLLHQYAEK